MPVRSSRTPSATTAIASPFPTRPNYVRRSSATSDAESAVTSTSELKEDQYSLFANAVATHDNTLGLSYQSQSHNLPTPSPSLSSASAMFPPKDHPPSRRSSFSSTNAAGSPALSTSRNYGRSPSPMPPLPAIRAAPSTPSWASVKLYGDEGFTNFFRRLTFSPDGGLLLTPAGHFDDPTVVPSRSSSSKTAATAVQPDDPPVRPKKASAASNLPDPASSSSVYIYSRANFSRPPVAHLPGHKTASVAVKFSPVLYELRSNVAGPGVPADVKKVVIEVGKDHSIEVDIGSVLPAVGVTSQIVPPSPSSSAAPPIPPMSPAPSAASPVPIRTPSQTGRGTQPVTGAVFALPYRMLFAVATQDTVMIYDTQQSGPVCMFTNLHYAPFTDIAW